MRACIALLLFLTSIPGFSQVERSVLIAEAQSNLSESLDEFREFLSMPNDAHIPVDLDPNINYLIDRFSSLGFLTERIPTGGIDLLLASRSVAHPVKTLLIYLQVDGQPVDPTKWNQKDPFTPVVKQQDGSVWNVIPWDRIHDDIDPEWRIFARSASDAKGPVAALLTSLEIMKEHDWQPNFDIKIIMDCEEELGSPHLPDAVLENREKLKADMLVIFDGPRHISNRPTLTFGARGITTMRLTTYGPRVPQHSGHYGNYAPNPALHLAQLLASMKDDQGRVVIPGFYDGIDLDASTLEKLEGVPDNEEQILRDLGIAKPDGVAGSYQESIQYPSLNIRGMSAAWVGSKVRTIIPDAAVVNLDIRTVKETDPQRLVDLIIRHIRDRGFHICEGEPTEAERQKYPRLLSMFYDISYDAYRTDFDEYVSVWLDNTLTGIFNEEPIKIRTSGGSIPIAPFVRTLGIPAVTVPVVNRDNNQHSPNENIRIGNYLDAIVTYLAILTTPME